MAKSTGKCKVCGAACNQDAGIKVPVGWFCGYAHLFEYQREKTAKARKRQAAKAMTKPTAAESSHIARVVSAGCIVCRNLGYGETPAEAHHIGNGTMGKRASNYEVISLCPNHHRYGGHGVAVHAGRKAFEARYGTERELLEQTRRELGL